jgi:hypothetical protein
MITKKIHKVIPLKTNQKLKELKHMISKHSDGRKINPEYLFYSRGGYVPRKFDYRIHLYVIDEDLVIEPGDWVHRRGSVFQASAEPLKNAEYLNTCPDSHKIIAATNRFLTSQVGIAEKDILDKAGQPYPEKIPERWLIPDLTGDFIEDYVYYDGYFDQIEIEYDGSEMVGFKLVKPEPDSFDEMIKLIYESTHDTNLRKAAMSVYKYKVKNLSSLKQNTKSSV